MGLADAMTISMASLANARAVPVSYFMVANAFAAVLIRTAAFRLISGVPRVRLAAPAAALMGSALLGLSFSSTSSMFIFFGLLFGIGIGIGFPTDLALVGDMLPAAYHPKATGLVLLVIDSGWMISPLVYGCFSPYLGVSNTFRVIGLAVFAAASMLYLRYWLPLTQGKLKIDGDC